MMKAKTFAIGVALLATFVLISAGSAQAQSERLKATIPFAVYAGDTLMPAGEYEEQQLAGGVVKLYHVASSKPVVFHTIPTIKVGREDSSGQLIFNGYGEDYFLTEMWWSGATGRQSLPSKIERELSARGSAPIRVAVR